MKKATLTFELLFPDNKTSKEIERAMTLKMNEIMYGGVDINNPQFVIVSEYGYFNGIKETFKIE